MSNAPGVEVARGRVRVRARPVVVAGRVGHVEQRRCRACARTPPCAGRTRWRRPSRPPTVTTLVPNADRHGGARTRRAGVRARSRPWWRRRVSVGVTGDDRPCAPGAVVPVTVTVRAGDHRAVGRRGDGHRQRRRAARTATYRSRTMRGCSTGRPAPRPSVSRTCWACAQVSGEAEPAAPAVDEADRGGRRVGAVRRRRQVRVLPGLLGHQPDARRGRAASRRSSAAAPAGRRSAAAARRARRTSTGHKCPEPTLPVGHGLPVGRAVRRVRLVAVAVPVLGARRRRCRTGRSRSAAVARMTVVHDRQRRAHVGVVRPAGCRAGSARGSPASTTARWSASGPPLPRL